MDENGRTILHEAMEQQTISIAKAGIVAQLNARTAILAAANPVNSKYDVKKSVISNIRLPPTLLSRFDLIYLMLDQISQKKDEKLAMHILNLYKMRDASEFTGNTGSGKKKGRGRGKQSGSRRKARGKGRRRSSKKAAQGMEIEDESKDVATAPQMGKAFLTKYINYARTNIHPQIPAKLINGIVEQYVSMRRLGVSKKTITATPRQLESIIRLAEALAKMRLSNRVAKKDVDEAVRLIKVATQSAATDPTTGLVDMDQLAIGVTNVSR